jgi:hypothetical protein
MWVLYCSDIEWVIEIWGVTFLVVLPKDKFAEMLKTTYLKKMKNGLQILIFLRCGLVDWPWNIKFMLTTMKVKQKIIISYLWCFLLLLFKFPKWTNWFVESMCFIDLVFLGDPKQTIECFCDDMADLEVK